MNYRKMLTDIGGWDNEFVSVNAGAVKEIIIAHEKLEAKVKEQAERINLLASFIQDTLNTKCKSSEKRKSSENSNKCFDCNDGERYRGEWCNRALNLISGNKALKDSDSCWYCEECGSEGNENNDGYTRHQLCFCSEACADNYDAKR